MEIHIHRRTRRRRNRGPHSNHRERTREGHQEVAGGSSEQSSYREIPGFYYDEDKKRYFRVTSGSRNPSSQYSAERIQKMDDEKQIKLKREAKGIPLLQSTPLLSLLSSRGTGVTSENKFARDITKCQFTSFQLVSKQNALDEAVSSDSAGRVFLCSQPDKWNIIGIYPQDDGNRVQQWFPKMNSNRELSLNPSPTSLAYPLGQVTDACLAPLNGMTSNFLWTSVLHNGNSEITLVPAEDDEDTSYPYCSFKWSIGQTAAWSCAWNQVTKNLAVGVEKVNLLIGAHTDYRMKLFNGQSNSLGLSFSNDGNVMYGSTRSKAVCASDLREADERRWTYSFPVGKRVTFLQTLPNDQLLVNGYDNLLRIYDIRVRKPVVEFREHINSNNHIKPVVSVDDGILLCLGDDYQARIWNFDDGILLKEIELPTNTSIKSIALTYLRQVISSNGILTVPTLLASVKDVFHIYQPFF